MAYRSVATETVPTDVASGATDAASGATAASGENADHADEASGAANRTPDSVADRRGRVGDRTDIRDREAGSRIVNRNAREADGFAADKEPGARKGDGNE